MVIRDMMQEKEGMHSQLHVLFTMDVEPPAAGSGSSGPVSDEAGMRSIRDFQAVLRQSGYRATYFVHPELIAACPEFYRDLENAGSGVGLHLHTTKFTASKQSRELGGLRAVEQKRLLEMAIEMFERGIGFRPRIFRPGCFSANDATYGVLRDLGFIGGGVSIPGRIWPERFCVWSGAYPYTHFVHESFRQCVGDLPFVEIPLSVDLTTPLRHNPVGFYHHPDLRPGGVYSDTDEVACDRRELLRNILRRMEADNPPCKTLVVDVHNDRDFTSRGSQAAQDLRTVLDGIEPGCRELGWEVVPATYAEVIQHYFDMHGRSVRNETERGNAESAGAGDAATRAPSYAGS